ncbi:hypothetical protein Tco_0989559 [Tanacetum coccineum]|uniref:Uncharacterized protein n=1 Tax=Tanacetum coccineum TaxID=301880 RepID=A0ABQ5EU53_9ASTR
MESRLGRGSWQLPVAIVRFPMSSDPDEAHHIERRGFKARKLTTTMYMYGVIKNSSSCCYIIIIAVVAKASFFAKAVVAKAVVALAALAIKKSLRHL